MNISRLRVLLKKGQTGTFRMLKPGELIEPADVICADTFYDYPSDKHIGQPAEATDCIIRFEFEKPIINRRTIHKKL